MGSIHRYNFSKRDWKCVNMKDFIEGETYAVEAVEGGKKQMVVS